MIKGALWISKDDEGNPKVDKKGNRYMSGNIEIDDHKYKVMMFKNEKTKDTQPDFNIVESGQKKEEFSDDIPF